MRCDFAEVGEDAKLERADLFFSAPQRLHIIVGGSAAWRHTLAAPRREPFFFRSDFSDQRFDRSTVRVDISGGGNIVQADIGRGGNIVGADIGCGSSIVRVDISGGGSIVQVGIGRGSHQAFRHDRPCFSGSERRIIDGSGEADQRAGQCILQADGHSLFRIGTDVFCGVGASGDLHMLNLKHFFICHSVPHSVQASAIDAEPEAFLYLSCCTSLSPGSFRRC